jgi:hypothetical protein
MDKENMVYINNEVLFSYKEVQKYVIYKKVDRIGNHHVK